MTEFTAPGPGAWRRLADHFPRALTPEYQLIYAATCPAGMAAYMEHYGVLARTLDVGFVHGHLYVAPVPLAGGRGATKVPPRPLVWLMARVHPTFRRRNRAARQALRDRPWRAAAERWFATERAEWVRRNTAVEATDPAGLDDAALAEHLEECRRNVTIGYRRHFELHGDDLLPVGLLIARCGEWGIAAADATAALVGASSAPHAGDVSPWMLVTGYDLDCLTWGELAGAGSRGTAPATLRTPAPFDLAPLVPADARDELRVLLDDARLAVRLRDDNGAITAAWPMGLLRRAMLEAGRRCTRADPALAVEATVAELTALLRGATAPTIDDLIDRRRTRAANSALDAPLVLGPEFGVPPLDALPRPIALIGMAQLATAEHMATGARAIGVGTASYTGRAIVVDDPAAAMLVFEPGDVIVTTATSPSWNTLLVEAGALVTTNGGLTSHAAVTARELGIPAIIGDPTACRRLHTDDIVTVDPLLATVTVAAG